MNNMNVIDRIDNLSDLEQDMFEWSRLPMKFKHMSDDECIKLHGMKNLQYYENIKSKLINNSPESSLYDDSITESVDFNDLGEKLIMSKELQTSPYIIIIDPNDDNETRLEKYKSYIALPMKFKRWSDYYSKDIYGYNVEDMFRMLSSKNLNEATIKDFINDAICEGRTLDILTYKAINEDVSDFEDGAESDLDFVFNKITPYFTPDEYDDLATEKLAENMDYQEWKTALREAIKEGNEQNIINLGWNPSVLFNDKNIEYARERQISWFKAHSPEVIDIRDLSERVEFDIQESSAFMDSLYKDKNLYPVYIVMSFSDTLFGYAERLIKNVTYSHAGLAVDSSLKEIFTFSFGKEYNGFTTESIDSYIKNSRKAVISVVTIFVDKETRDKIYSTLNELQKNKKKTKYGFGNILNILLNRAKEYPYPENLSLVCSQFVDTILKLVNINITNKASNLVIPQDFQISNNPKVYKVYEGLCTRYKEADVEKNIKLLFYHGDIKNIKYNDPIKINFTESVIETIKTLLTPTPIVEKMIPFRVNNNGEVEINLYVSLEDQYQQSHKLLISYDESNIEGIKKELAHMFYINTVIEKKIKKMKKSDEEYQALINLRARVLNDFKTYFKEVAKFDKDFDFSEYYQHSEYNANVVKIDKPTMKYTGQTIKRMITSMLRFR